MSSKPMFEPVPSQAIDFAYEFVARMRTRDDIQVKPTIRQSLAIPRLLISRYFRKGSLVLDDFINAAVFTSYPADQEIAHLVAEEVIFGSATLDQVPNQEIRVESKSKGDEEDSLESIISSIMWELELARSIDESEIMSAFDYLQELKSRPENDMYEAASQYLRDGDLILKGVDSDDALRETISSILSEKFGSLTLDDFRNAQALSILDDLAGSSSASERIVARALAGDPDIPKQISDLIQYDAISAAKALRALQKLGLIDDNTFKQLDKSIQSTLTDLNDAASYSAIMERPPSNIDGHIDSAATEFDLEESMNFVSDIMSSTNKSYHEQLIESYLRHYSEGAMHRVSFRQLAWCPPKNQAWEKLLDKHVETIIDSASAHSSPSDFLIQQAKLMAKLTKSNFPINNEKKKKWKESAQKIVDEAVRLSQSKGQLRRNVRICRRADQYPSEESIREAGKRLGMTENEILELVNPSFTTIKKMIESGISDFERLHELISAADLRHSQVETLANLAFEKENVGALGALAHHNLGIVLKIMQNRSMGKKQDQDTMEGLLIRAISAGPATSIIKMWFNYRESLPPDLKQKIWHLSKRILINLGQRYARHSMGTSMLGGIQLSTTIRPFRLGDDLDLIDLEETIDHLQSKGIVDFRTIDIDDFRVIETYHGNRCFIWALDKSGSMDSAEKLGMLSISVMAGLYAVQKDDFGVALFDDRTHIVKEVADRQVPIEQVAAQLLELKAGGGTGAQRVMKWGLEGFKLSKARDKIFIMNSDMVLSDEKQSLEIAKTMHLRGIKVVIIVPANEYNGSTVNAFVNQASASVIELNSLDELPAKLLSVTDY